MEKLKNRSFTILLQISDEELRPFTVLVDKILTVKDNDLTGDISELEAEIDRLVYDLYGLTKEERTVVKNSA